MTQRRRDIEFAAMMFVLLAFIAALCAVSAFTQEPSHTMPAMCKNQDAKYTDAGTLTCFKK